MYDTTSTIDDGALARRAMLCLHTRGLCGAEQVVIKAAGGTVILCGELASREVKRQCLECCRHVAGVVRVVDQLRVSAATKNAPATSVEAEVGGLPWLSYRTRFATAPDPPAGP